MGVYVAFYKGRKTIRHPYDLLAKFADWLTRKVTKGEYSHCEIAIQSSGELYYCYSSSVRDGGVRVKEMNLPQDKWDLIKIDADKDLIIDFYLRTKGMKYDWFGAIGVVLKTKQAKSKYFCSEWVFECLGGKESWRFSPNELYAILNSDVYKKENIIDILS